MSRSHDPERRALILAALASAGLAATGGAAHAEEEVEDEPTEDEIDAIADAMAEVVADGFSAWLGSASYVGGEIHGVVLYGGALVSTVDLEAYLAEGFADEGIGEQFAGVVATTVATAWAEWVDGWTMASTRAFPDFATVSGAEAPVTEAEPAPLKPQTSSGYRKLREAQLRKGLEDDLGDIVKDPSKADIVHEFAWKVGQRVEDWSPLAMVEGILGSGPVPTFAPPYIPVGPVSGGKTIDGPVTITTM